MSKSETTGMRVLVTGGRRYPDREAVFSALDRLHAKCGISVVAHGATPTQTGADWHADAWAKTRGVPVVPYPVLHDVDGPWPAAGPKRNARMFADFHPDGVVAFPGDRGTENMKAIAAAGSVKVWEPVK